MMHLYFDPKTYELFDHDNHVAALPRDTHNFVRNECKRWLHRHGPHCGRFRVLNQRKMEARCFDAMDALPEFDRPIAGDLFEIEFKDRREIAARVAARNPFIMPPPMKLKWDVTPHRVGLERRAMEQMAKLRDMGMEQLLRPRHEIEAIKAAAKAPVKVKPKAKPKAQHSVWRDGDHFIAHLRKRGFQTLGAGAFSTVLGKPGSDRVFKVCRRPDPWLDYVVWASKEGFAGGLAPRVFSYRVITGKHVKFFVAVMERLERTISDVAFSNRRATQAHANIRSFIEERDDSAGLRAEKDVPGALRFGLSFRLEFKHGLDLHKGNFMLRKDGSMVCTDPIYNDAGVDDLPTSAPPRMRSKDLQALSLAA